MTNILSLPVELLPKIFKHIYSNHQLAECRLVCSKWSEPALTAMLSNTILLMTRDKALGLYAQLFSNPSRGKFIRDIYIFEEFSALWMIKAMFKAAPIPNVESFDGACLSEFYNTLYEIIQENPSALSKLKILPEYSETINQTYCNVLLAVRDTLSVIEISNRNEYLNETMTKFTLQLNTFSNLTTLRYEGKFQRAFDVDVLLKGCIYLKTLTLNCLLNNGPLDKRIVDQWIANDVTQVATLQELTLGRQCQCDLVEYLVYKYPNLKDITLQNSHYTYVAADVMSLFTANMDRIIQAIKDVPNKKLSFWMEHGENFLSVVEYFTQKGLHFRIAKKQDPKYLRIYIDRL